MQLCRVGGHSSSAVSTDPIAFLRSLVGCLSAKCKDQCVFTSTGIEGFRATSVNMKRVYIIMRGVADTLLPYTLPFL
jgi:hypothetical protein